ncbi:hypothetical protein QBC38DRAFT_454800 [Podospora fimiseda]|uniref:Uncharacterized protein n=1 Tax=Podospora fimiseda TaxID=252190 RepID=A0AAN7BQN6_9PEZI|nr:hypothetical protein QBC38DRAFT_454800 [Podospora fimiseda]
MASRLLLSRTLLRRSAAVGLATSGAGFLLIHNQRPMRFDSPPPPPPVIQQTNTYATKKPERKDRLDSEVIRQLSSGSLSGIYLYPL